MYIFLVLPYIALLVSCQPNPKSFTRDLPIPDPAPPPPKPLELIKCPKGYHPISFHECATLPYASVPIEARCPPGHVIGIEKAKICKDRERVSAGPACDAPYVLNVDVCERRILYSGRLSCQPGEISWKGVCLTAKHIHMEADCPKDDREVHGELGPDGRAYCVRKQHYNGTWSENAPHCDHASHHISTLWDKDGEKFDPPFVFCENRTKTATKRRCPKDSVPFYTHMHVRGNKPALIYNERLGDPAFTCALISEVPQQPSCPHTNQKAWIYPLMPPLERIFLEKVPGITENGTNVKRAADGSKPGRPRKKWLFESPGYKTAENTTDADEDEDVATRRKKGQERRALRRLTPYDWVSPRSFDVVRPTPTPRPAASFFSGAFKPLLSFTGRSRDSGVPIFPFNNTSAKDTKSGEDGDGDGDGGKEKEEEDEEEEEEDEEEEEEEEEEGEDLNARITRLYKANKDDIKLPLLMSPQQFLVDLAPMPRTFIEEGVLWRMFLEQDLYVPVCVASDVRKPYLLCPDTHYFGGDNTCKPLDQSEPLVICPEDYKLDPTSLWPDLPYKYLKQAAKKGIYPPPTEGGKKEKKQKDDKKQKEVDRRLQTIPPKLKDLKEVNLYPKCVGMLPALTDYACPPESLMDVANGLCLFANVTNVEKSTSRQELELAHGEQGGALWDAVIRMEHYGRESPYSRQEAEGPLQIWTDNSGFFVNNSAVDMSKRRLPFVSSLLPMRIFRDVFETVYETRRGDRLILKDTNSTDMKVHLQWFTEQNVFDWVHQKRDRQVEYLIAVTADIIASSKLHPENLDIYFEHPQDETSEKREKVKELLENFKGPYRLEGAGKLSLYRPVFDRYIGLDLGEK